MKVPPFDKVRLQQSHARASMLHRGKYEHPERLATAAITASFNNYAALGTKTEGFSRVSWSPDTTRELGRPHSRNLVVRRSWANDFERYRREHFTRSYGIHLANYHSSYLQSSVR
jgi:hypothetical protein